MLQHVMFDSGYLFFDSGEVINHDKLSYLICAHTKLGLIMRRLCQ